MSVTLENVEPPANISICCEQLGVLIVLILYEFSILRNVRSLLSVAPVIPTCHFEEATPMEAISPNHTDGRFLESLKSDGLLNLDNAYRILREREREGERELLLGTSNM